MRFELTIIRFAVVMASARAVVASRLTEFVLPERPEGITAGPGKSIYVSQIRTGEVLAIHVKSGDITTVVDDKGDGRQAWGMATYKGALFVAGGGSSFGTGRPKVYVYDTDTGDELAVCSPCSLSFFGDFLNDITVSDGLAYITDSIGENVMVLDAKRALKGECVTWELELPESLKPSFADDFGANGVAPYAKGILVADELKGAVWYIPISASDFDGLPKCSKVSPYGSIAIIPECPQDNEGNYVSDDSCALFGDGLAIRGRKLFVTQNLVNEIGVFKLRKLGSRFGKVSAKKVKTLTSPAFNTPAVSAIVGRKIYSTNSRFGDPDFICDDTMCDPVQPLDGDEKVVAVKIR